MSNWRPELGDYDNPIEKKNQNKLWILILNQPNVG